MDVKELKNSVLNIQFSNAGCNVTSVS